MDKYIYIKTVSRISINGELEELHFNKGINVISGKPNAGKTTWLKQLDYILGKNATINEVFADDDLANKYVELSAILEINGVEVVLIRKPKEPGMAAKIFINGEPILATDFSNEFLKIIDIPEDVKFPKGNPFTSQWIELSFRSLYRHIYRREDLWSDIADKQPTNEQYAAQYQLFGIAKKIYSKEYDQNVNDEKKLTLLEAQKQQYDEILNRIVQEMSPKGAELFHYATNSEVQIRIATLEDDLKGIETERSQVVEKHLAEVKEIKENVISQEVELINKKVRLIKEIESNSTSLSKLYKKFNEYKSLQESISDELGKLKRTKKSGAIADMKITHCPACDQILKKQKKVKDEENCFLCSEPIITETAEPTINRVDFELSQLDSEKKELDEMAISILKEIAVQENHIKYLNEQIYYIDLEITPLKNKLFALSYQDLSELDVKRGRIQEQIQNYKRLQMNIAFKLTLASQIEMLRTKMQKEKALQDDTTSNINFSRIAEDMEGGMQYYVNQISKNGHDRDLWSHKGKINVGINEAKIVYYVNNKSWDALGGQDKDIFLLAYHFGLLNLSNRQNYNYPGLSIIDLPPELGEAKADSYNYIVAPFAKYCKVFAEKKHLQVIFAGRSFENLPNAHIINLETTWK
jgi:hypothetical protein